MDSAKTEEEKIKALLHGEERLVVGKEEGTLSVCFPWSYFVPANSCSAQAVPFRGPPQPGENDKTPPGYITAIDATCQDTSKSSALLSTTPISSPSRGP